MNEKELASLVEEMREEFQIPPYYEDKQLAKKVNTQLGD